jgi:tight adherence protein C
MRLALVSGLMSWAGTTLLLNEVRWFRRRSLAARLGPYLPGAAPAVGRRAGVLSVGSLRELIGPLASSFGGAVARLAGIDEPLAARLERLHADADPTAFRVRQLGWSGIGLALGAATATVLRLPAPFGLGVALGGAALAFLVVEQRLARASAAWQRKTFLELPVVAEQLGMLLSSGYSLGAALNRLARRGVGVIGRDLVRVSGRVRQGLTEIDALREWAAIVDVGGVDRLVAILALNREAGDLGRLIAEEARAIRGDVHRVMVAAIERRAQQVWIPVTVATLVPGVLFMAVTFVEALKVFSGE